MNDQSRYHYTECGLDNVWLVNGVERHDTPYGAGVSIVDVDGLHAAIGLRIADRADQMAGAEFRFLRHELDLSQRTLGNLLGVDGQSIKRWERKSNTSLDGPGPRLLAALYRESTTGDPDLSRSLEMLADLDAERHRQITLARTATDEWTVCAA
ncbi:transcriptional regulator [Roseobacter sp. HKCCD9010]|uniref:helix-turn-helix domain-containing protein n=1 Tax=unclassified Roseobacter TaxID=196798 RepID=UPI001490A299|nr:MULTISPECIES: transcriptional regulator [unclassified Roseobacter]MBF9052582.1 transcriptional regulator [Rhodobacterales bacterium HKCCD4356]NNV14522.1 transcriptional regulator [Roseobacter sp. HKCCD7357]NNV18785.1 transcriptional regulator [Roseobacter sp. HKCCD8768]NNV28211.1 transcriptional regulator [Roseobacter sp. HKCCD8192]NNV32309.1 transcriptional regulator [Roseobacter sp. HKCCD9061]